MEQQSSKLYILKITLEETEPPVWRRFVMPGDASLDLLHDMIQLVMGWCAGHLYEFEIKGNKYADLEMVDDCNEDTKDSVETTLEQLNLSEKDHFNYVYDFGDYWVHHIDVEEIREAKPFEPEFGCRGGARNCPPEDCGGVMGYEDIISAIRDPKHPRRKELSEWMDLEEFDPEEFDLDSVNEQIQLEFMFDEEDAISLIEDIDEKDDDVKKKNVIRSLALITNNQMMSNNPPEVRETLERLVNEGLSEEDAFAMVVSTVTVEICECADSGQFNDKRLVSRLNKLPIMES